MWGKKKEKSKEGETPTKEGTDASSSADTVNTTATPTKDTTATATATSSTTSTSSSNATENSLGSPTNSTPTTATDANASTTASASTRLDLEMQIAGNLWKKDTAGSNTWTERYFVLKDGYLLYYPDRKTPMTQFDMHPKGMLPLDGVDIATERTGPSKSLQSGIRISHPSFGTKSMILCAHNDEERDKWVTALQNSRTITYTGITTSTVQTEDLKNKYTELLAKYEKNEKLLAKRAEQVDKLVAQTRNLYRAIEKAEQKYNIKIDVSENNEGGGTVPTNITPAPTILPPPSTFMHPVTSQAPAFMVVNTVVPSPPVVPVVNDTYDNGSVHSNSSAGPSRHSSIFDASSTTVTNQGEITSNVNGLPSYVAAPPRPTNNALPTVTTVRPPTLPATVVAPPRPNTVPVPVPAATTTTTTVLPTTMVAPPRPGGGGLPPTITAPPNKPGSASTTANVTVAVPPPVVVPEPTLPVAAVTPDDGSSTGSSVGTVPVKITAPPNKPGGNRTKTAFGQAMAPRT